MREEIVDIVARHAHHDGLNDTELEGLKLIRISRPMSQLPGKYPRSVCALVRGTKKIYLSGEAISLDEGRYLCVDALVPVHSVMPYITPQEPLLGFALDLEVRSTVELLLELEDTPVKELSGKQTFGVLTTLPWCEAFAEAVLGLLRLLDDPVALQVLGREKLREVLFVVVRNGGGLFGRRSNARALWPVINHIRDHLNESLTVDDLAKEARMSKAALHRKFKQTTMLSPLLFIKLLRLNEAATMMMAGSKISQAAAKVGFGIHSHFSREFRRHYGCSPSAWLDSLLAQQEFGVGADM